MDSATVQSQAKTLEIQLAVLKAQMAHTDPGPSLKTLGDLRGMLSGKGNFTEEAIDQAQYAFDWDAVPER